MPLSLTLQLFEVFDDILQSAQRAPALLPAGTATAALVGAAAAGDATAAFCLLPASLAGVSAGLAAWAATGVTPGNGRARPGAAGCAQAPLRGLDERVDACEALSHLLALLVLARVVVRGSRDETAAASCAK